jgi:hypothetical protein
MGRLSVSPRYLLDDRVYRLQPVFPCDLLAFSLRAAIVRQSDFVDTTLSFDHLNR